MEHSEIIKRAATAQMLSWCRHEKSGALQHRQCCATRFWMEVIVKGIGPENDFRLSRARRRCFLNVRCDDPTISHPVLKTNSGEFRKFALEGQSKKSIYDRSHHAAAVHKIYQCGNR